MTANIFTFFQETVLRRGFGFILNVVYNHAAPRHSPNGFVLCSRLAVYFKNKRPDGVTKNPVFRLNVKNTIAMKKKITLHLLKIVSAVSAGLFAFGTALSANPKDSRDTSVLSVIHKYEGKDGVDAINMGPFLLGIARMAAGNEEGAEFLDYLDRMAVFSADGVSSGLRTEITGDLDRALEGYSPAMEMKDGEDEMSVYIRQKNEDVISEIVIVSRSELAVIVMIGDMPVSELEKIVTEASEQ